MIEQLKHRVGLTGNQCESDLCDNSAEPEIDLCWTCTRANARRGVVDGEIAAAWYLFCDDCNRDKPWIAIQDHGDPKPNQCDHCGSTSVVYQKIDTAAAETFDRFIGEIQQ